MQAESAKVAACIVAYNPDIMRIKENIENIINQVDILIIVWNSEKINIGYNFENGKIVHIENESNCGIAKAINQAVDYCERNKYEWLLTLDQDSICPTDLILSYMPYCENDIGIITCGIHYNNELTKNTEKATYIKECIQSGALLNIDVATAVNGMDEKMFIDQVDFEYCYRVRKKGYKIVQVNGVTIDHRLGELAIKKVGPIKFYVGNHSSFRKYYIARNTIYCHNIHPEWRTKDYCFKKIGGLLFKTILFENDKKNKCKAIIRGIFDARKMQVSPAVNN